MNDTLKKLTRPTMKKLLKLYMSEDYGINNAFAKEASKTFGISIEECHLIWQAFDTAYVVWFLRKTE
jgi:hypothetical protein